MGCTSCGCSWGAHTDIGYGTYHCSSCKAHCRWILSDGADWCYICRKKLNGEGPLRYRHYDRDSKPGPNINTMN